MKILLAGPTETSALRASLGLRLEGAPPGTAQTPIAPLAGALRKYGISVHIVLTEPTIDVPLRIEEDGVIVEYVPIRAEPRYRARVRSRDLFEVEIEALTNAYRVAAPDLVHAHWTYEYAEAAVRSRLPHVVTMHDVGWQNVALYRNLYRVVRLAMMLRVMPRIGHLTVVAPFMKKWARLHGYLGPVDVVPNGVELPQSSFSGPSTFDRQPVRIVSIGDPTRRKNIAASVAAFRLVRARIPDAELHLFGAGLDGGFAEGEPGIVAHGKVGHPDLMRFLSENATLLIHPSLQECMPVILVEAMARGIPVVAGENSGGVPYVADRGDAAVLVDVRSSDAIARAVLHLLMNPQVFKNFSRSGFDRVISHFTSDAVAKQYMTVYRSVIKK